MLQSDRFPTEYRNKLTSQINSWLGDMIAAGRFHPESRRSSNGTSHATEAEYKLAEQFVMVCLSDPHKRADDALDNDLANLVTLTGRRHHQIKENEEAVAYARSLVCREEDLCQVFASKLAGELQGAIKALDALESKNPEFAAELWRVRLLTVPMFHTHAFLIQKIDDSSHVADEGSKLFVIATPYWLKEIPKHQLLDSRTFLFGFKDAQPIVGIKAPRMSIEEEDSPPKEKNYGKRKRQY